MFPEVKAPGLTLKEEIHGVLKQPESGTTKGTPYENNTELLPIKPYGYDREHTVPLPAKGRESARIVAGVGGERYLTQDHYGCFVRIR